MHYIDPDTQYTLVQSAANLRDMDAVVRLVDAGAPWFLPPGQRVKDGSVYYPPEILSINNKNVTVGVVWWVCLVVQRHHC